MNRKLVTIIASLVIVAALAWLYLSHRPTLVPFTGPQFERLGQFAGDEISKFLENHGTIVIVQWDATFAGIPKYDAQIAQLKHQVVSRGVTVSAVETLQVTKGNAAASRARFVRLVDQYSAANAIVLVGSPYGLRVADLAALPSPHPPLISVLAFQSGLKTLFDQHLITLAITDALLTENIKSSDRDFLVLTAENATALPPNQEASNAP